MNDPKKTTVDASQEDDGAGPEQGSDSDGSEDPDHAEEEEPQNREDMRKIQAKYKNNKRTAAHFYHQRYVQIEMRIIYLGAQALLEEFQEALKQQKQGQVSRSFHCVVFQRLRLD